LARGRQRVTQEWLERSTGYTDKPVSQALAYLREVGLVDQAAGGWQLVKERMMQLPLVMQSEEKRLNHRERRAREILKFRLMKSD
jgi:hypothetical protein